MNKIRKSILFLFIAAPLALVSCKKVSNVPMITLYSIDSGKTVVVAKGSIIFATVSNPGDGGFQYNAWQYNNTILHLDNHTFNPPVNRMMIGDFGSDTWKFSAAASGKTILKLSATQSYTITMISDTIVVR